MRFPFSGVIPINKPRGVTSRRVVNAVSKALSMRACGHAGTLDPLASGVLVVCVGHATRLVEFVQQQTKEYVGTFEFGRWSASDDLETEVMVETNPCKPSRCELEAACDQFRGDIQQRPCDYSAVHIDGKRAYRLARAGLPVVAKAKPVRIFRLEITEYQWPHLELAIECSSGTFVRAIGRDLALCLGTRAVMKSLERQAIGSFRVADSLPLELLWNEASRTSNQSVAQAALLPSLCAVAHLPCVVLSEEQTAMLARGGLMDAHGCASVGPPEGPAAAVNQSGELVGMLRVHTSGQFRLRPNFIGV